MAIAQVKPYEGRADDLPVDRHGFDLGKTDAKLGEAGISGVVGVVSVAMSLVIVLLLSLLGSGAFSSSKSGGSMSVFSNSSAEQQLKLCVEGRPSSYGDPPTQAQQAQCTRDLALQLGGAPVVPAPTPTSNPSPTISIPSSFPGG